MMNCRVLFPCLLVLPALAQAEPSPPNRALAFIQDYVASLESPQDRAAKRDICLRIIAKRYDPFFNQASLPASEETQVRITLADRMLTIAREALLLSQDGLDPVAASKAQETTAEAAHTALAAILSPEHLRALRSFDHDIAAARVTEAVDRLGVPIPPEHRPAVDAAFRDTYLDWADCRVNLGDVPLRGLLTPMTPSQISRARRLLLEHEATYAQLESEMGSEARAAFLEKMRSLLDPALCDRLAVVLPPKRR